MIWTIFSFLGPLKENQLQEHMLYVRSRPNWITGPGPNRGQLENQSHMVLKTGFQDGGNRTQIFTHKIIILA